MIITLCLVAVLVIVVISVAVVVPEILMRQNSWRGDFVREFGFNPPRDAAGRERKLQEVLRQLRQVGTFQARLPVIASGHARQGNPAVAVLAAVVSSADSNSANSSRKQYERKLMLARQAGFSKQALDALDAELRLSSYSQIQPKGGACAPSCW